MSEIQVSFVVSGDKEMEAAFNKAISTADRFDKRMKDLLGRAGKIGGPWIDPALSQHFAATEQQAKRLNTQLEAARGAGKSGSLGFLAFSQAVEDAQYGLKGVLNNIPQAVIGFGGSAGLAGALSLAAVGAYQAWQAFERFAGITEIEKWAKASTAAMDEFTASLEKNRQATEDLQRAGTAASARETQSSIVSHAISRDLGEDPAFQASLRARAEAAARERARMDALSSAAGSISISGEDFRAQGSREWQAAAAKATETQRRAVEDLAIAQENLNKLSLQYAKIQANLNTIITPLQAQRSTSGFDAEELRKTIASKEAELARNKKLIEALPESQDKRNFQLRNTALEKQIASEKALSDEKQKQVQLDEQLIQKALQQADASKKAIDTQAAGFRKQVDASREILKNIESLNIARAKSIQFEALRGQNSSLKQTLETATDQKKSANDFADELQIAGATLELGKKKGEQLAKEIELRKQAADLAEQSGISEERALQDLRALNTAREKITNQPTGSIAERAAARAQKRDEERQRKRDEAVQEAARKREERAAERKRDKLDPSKDKPADLQKEAERIRKEAAEKERKAREDLTKNIEKQTKLQEEIREMLTHVAAA